MAVNIVKKTGTTNTTVSAGRSIKYIVIHYTAGVSSASGKAADTAAWFANSAAGASADFIVDDANIVQYNPDPTNRYCWAVGGSKQSTKGGSLYGTAKNANSISIEICSTNSTGKVKDANDSTWSLSSKAVTKAVELTKYLMNLYGIAADHVIRHYDVNGKLCPGVKGWNADSGSEAKWTSFKNRLGSADTQEDEAESAAVPYTVKVTIDDLNIRKGPGKSYAKTGKYTGKGTFTIVKESNGWGLLKAYEKNEDGWISLSYTTKAS